MPRDLLRAKSVSELQFPTEFTPEQLERMRQLVQRENTRGATPDDHNLARKLTEYCSIARNLQQRSA